MKRSTAEVVRKTKETSVTARIDLAGTGGYDVTTDNRFLTHMMESWARYAGFDLTLRATGDLDHHLVEDVAITMGQAFRRAFANAPCQRIAYEFVPMDETLVLCAVDVVDRPYYSGELPIPLWEHWFRSFAMEARINLHLDVLRGRDTHHIIEASIKAFGRALRKALEPRQQEISTKGVVASEAGEPGAGGQGGEGGTASDVERMTDLSLEGAAAHALAKSTSQDAAAGKNADSDAGDGGTRSKASATRSVQRPPAGD